MLCKRVCGSMGVSCACPAALQQQASAVPRIRATRIRATSAFKNGAVRSVPHQAAPRR